MVLYFLVAVIFSLSYWHFVVVCQLLERSLICLRSEMCVVVNSALFSSPYCGSRSLWLGRRAYCKWRQAAGVSSPSQLQIRPNSFSLRIVASTLGG